MSEKLKSRKLWVALITAVVIFLNDVFEFGLDEVTITALVTTAVGYVLGQGAVDALDRSSFNKGQAEVQVKAMELQSGPINPE